VDARVVVEEWRLGDWRTVIHVGDRVHFLAFLCDADRREGRRDLLGVLADTITHDIADMETELTVDLHGRVDAIRAVYATFSTRTGGTTIPGSGHLEPLQEASPITGDLRFDEGVIIADLIDLADEKSLTQTPHADERAVQLPSRR